ncbi:hypothetical protein QBC46DRAFT_341514 [Diplogelasinospora grovesii]|uniref:Uncharacterized protein n=1 Tax=Diplogelasinospora grovesii TaxID=303347 RepID=A0AAN6N761_9PEZI|nr:hypothetical protein QBC46DRAFT_341514 [Diplogelasinospora grovesii]
MLARIPATRALLRASPSQAVKRHQIRRYATEPPKSSGDGGGQPNKNLIYLGIGALLLGGLYVTFVAQPSKVAEKTKGNDSTSPPAR